VALTRPDIERLYRQLRAPDQGRRRFQLGQPVPCVVRIGTGSSLLESSALRLCVSATMIVDACWGRGADAVIADALAALDRIGELVAELATEPADVKSIRRPFP
jgi:hypothetical protein